MGRADGWLESGGLPVYFLVRVRGKEWGAPADGAGDDEAYGNGCCESEAPEGWWWRWFWHIVWSGFGPWRTYGCWWGEAWSVMSIQKRD